MPISHSYDHQSACWSIHPLNSSSKCIGKWDVDNRSYILADNTERIRRSEAKYTKNKCFKCLWSILHAKTSFSYPILKAQCNYSFLHGKCIELPTILPVWSFSSLNVLQKTVVPANKLQSGSTADNLHPPILCLHFWATCECHTKLLKPSCRIYKLTIDLFIILPKTSNLPFYHTASYFNWTHQQSNIFHDIKWRRFSLNRTFGMCSTDYKTWA